MDNIETYVNKAVAEFEARPIATTIKGLFILFVIKQAIKWFKN